MTASPRHAPVLFVAGAALACVLPTLLAFNSPPSSTFFNQAAAVLGWAVFLGLMASLAVPSLADDGPAAGGHRPAGLPLQSALLLLALAPLLSQGLGSLPASLAWSAAGMGLAAWLVATVGVAQGAGVQAQGRAARLQGAVPAFLLALAVAGLLSAAVAMVQVFAPGWADGRWIAVTSIAGRATGNMRQPNHLSSLLLWALVAVWWLAVSGRWRRPWAALAAAMLVLALVLSASRTGVVGLVLLALWAAVDRRPPRGMRLALGAGPLLYLLFWLALTAWAHQGHAFGGEARFSAQGDISSSRFGIWANTLTLVAQNPWFGVGWGEFNFAWSLTAFPGRPTAFFDHTHNLPLQLMVELGIPLALLVLGLLAWGLWRAFCHTRRAEGAQAMALRAAFMVVLLAAVHSMLEYPLWYAYFLLPTVFAWGLCLGASPTVAGVVAGRGAGEEADGEVGEEVADETERAARPGSGAGPAWRHATPVAAPGQRALMLAAAALMLLGGLAALADYRRVVVIFSPPANAGPLADRIDDGRHSWFFAHHADYAAATTAERPAEAMASFKVATHYLLDTRLMLAWARAYAAQGDLERARYLAQRLREFRNPASREFFALCEEPLPLPAAEKPFQCTEPAQAFSFRDFR